jgi:hypothetical protein
MSTLQRVPDGNAPGLVLSSNDPMRGSGAARLEPAGMIVDGYVRVRG